MKKNSVSKWHAVKAKAREYTGKATAAASFMTVSGLAAAQTSSIDTTDILAAIADGKTAALAVSIAGTVALLAIRYSKLPRGA